jgi:hypothetical protein
MAPRRRRFISFRFSMSGTRSAGMLLAAWHVMLRWLARSRPIPRPSPFTGLPSAARDRQSCHCRQGHHRISICMKKPCYAIQMQLWWARLKNALVETSDAMDRLCFSSARRQTHETRVNARGGRRPAAEEGSCCSPGWGWRRSRAPRRSPWPQQGRSGPRRLVFTHWRPLACG